MALTPSDESQVLKFIPTEENDDPLYDRQYHESKIKYAKVFNPNFTRAESWAISMYLGPTYYCQGINRALLEMPMLPTEREKFLLIARAAQSALQKLPDLTKEGIRGLPQPDARLSPADYLKRFVHGRVREHFRPEILIWGGNATRATLAAVSSDVGR